MHPLFCSPNRQLEQAAMPANKPVKQYDPNDPSLDHFAAALQAMSMGLKEETVMCFRYDSLANHFFVCMLTI
jgi:hypothetical protein